VERGTLPVSFVSAEPSLAGRPAGCAGREIATTAGQRLCRVFVGESASEASDEEQERAKNRRVELAER
jgi:hypothetical protein